jgi:hypothetical protein
MRRLKLKMLILMFAIFAISSFISLLCQDDSLVRRDSVEAGIIPTMITVNASVSDMGMKTHAIMSVFERVNVLTES